MDLKNLQIPKFPKISKAIIITIVFLFLVLLAVFVLVSPLLTIAFIFYKMFDSFDLWYHRKVQLKAKTEQNKDFLKWK